MRFGRIRLRGFKSFVDELVDMDSLHAVCISGENGSGKSTLVVDAPLWALFGSQHADLDSVVNERSREARVDLEVVSGDERYLISRSRVRGGTSGLTVQRKGADSWEPVVAGMSPGQQFIDKVLLKGCTYREFISSVYMVQGQHSVFTRATPAEAKAVFMALLALDQWKARAEHVNALRRETEKRVAKYQALVEDGARSTAVDTAPLIEGLLVQKEGLAARLEEIEIVEQRVRTVKLDINHSHSELEAVLTMIRDAEDLYEESESTNKCYVCGQSLVGERLESVQAALTQKLEGLRLEEASIRTRLAAQEAELADAGTYDQNEHKQVMMNLRSVQENLAVAEFQRDNRVSAMKQLENDKVVLASEEELLGVLLIAERAFGRDGIPAYLIDGAIPHVEQVANELLEVMSDGDLGLRIETQKLTKTAGMKESLEILVSDASGAWRPFSTYSGGEGFRINFALRVALAELVAQRSGLDLSMFVIDEPEGLDAPGREALVGALAAISSRFEHIALISHHSDLKNALPQSVVVTKKDGLSHLTVGE
jgi:DNA repair exonuclease SbcCD ATPase subunit